MFIMENNYLILEYIYLFLIACENMKQNIYSCKYSKLNILII